MEEKTKESYRKLAKFFYNERIDGEPTPKKIVDALKRAAPDFRPAYWRKLRNALELDQGEKGFSKAVERIKSTQNPLTKKSLIAKTFGKKVEYKKKQKRVKFLNDDDFDKLYENADRETRAVLMIGKITGCRPAEMQSIAVEINYDADIAVASIVGAKKEKTGLRGIDRMIKLTGQDAENLEIAVQDLQAMQDPKSGKIHVIQERLQRLAKKTFPRRKTLPSLYSLRHTMGSVLKASGLDRKSIAYVMGHQSTKSVECYGNRRSGGSSARSIAPAIDNTALNQLIRENHTQPPTKPQNTLKNDLSNEFGM
ncbi:site-specific integrase [Candidatus Peregrinibacteria bacterium]|jgi:integrase|nr:site-specific integrase [Candidatus Peregrinibacteria bacterium]